MKTEKLTNLVQIRLTDAQLAKVDKACKATGANRNGLMRFLVDRHLDEHLERVGATVPSNTPFSTTHGAALRAA